MTKQITLDELEKYLWQAAVDLRGQIDAAAYKCSSSASVMFAMRNISNT